MSTAFAGAVHGADGRPLDQIRLTGLSATGHHGVFEHERLEGQLFRADVVLHLDTRPAAAGDDLDDTVSYAVVAEDVVAVLAGSPADLIETVAERVAAVVLRHPAIESVDVAVHKPQAPIAVPFDDVQVVIRRDRVKVPVVPAVPVVPDAVPRVVPIPVGSISPAVLGQIAVTEAPAPQDEHVPMPPSIQPVSPVPAPDRSPDQGVFASAPEEHDPVAGDRGTGGVSDQEFVAALDSFYSAPEDALSAPTADFVPTGEVEVPAERTLRPALEESPAEPVADVPEALPGAVAPVEDHLSDAPAVAPAAPVEAAVPAVYAVPDGGASVATAAAAERTPTEVVHEAHEPFVDEARVQPLPVEMSSAQTVPAASTLPLPEPAVALAQRNPVRAQDLAEAPVEHAAPELPVVPQPEPQPEPEPVPLPVHEPEPEPEPARPLDRLDEAPTGFVPVVLALGANLGDAQQTLRDAVTDLDRISGLEITDVSPLARTAAVGGPEQPDYLNAILLARTTLSPRALLHATQGVEDAHGRLRAERNGPRTLDVDLIVFGTVTEFTEDLELPHPRAHERAFVLEPWSQIAPDAVLPGLGGGPVATLAATAPDRGGIRWLALDWLTDAEPEPDAAPAPPRVEGSPAAPAEPSRQDPPARQAEVVAPEAATSPTPPAPPGGTQPPAPRDAGGHGPVQAPVNPYVPEQPPVPPVQPPPPAPAHPERAVEEAGPFVPSFHPVHPQDGQEPPHAQVPPLWADVSHAVPVADPRPAATPQHATPGEPVTPSFHPVHPAPTVSFQPPQAPPAPLPPAHPDPQSSQPVAPAPQQPPVTGTPMTFPADLRGPSA